MRIRFGLITLALALAGASQVFASPPLELSVVRILNRSQRSNWYAPWNALGSSTSTGSGFIIEGGLIMTNAHVVSDARLLYVFLHNDPNPHQLRVKIIGHDCDLALVEPVEEGLLDGYPALDFGPLPAHRSTVETYGFPAGGERISSTRGVVSRIEMQAYAHSGIDAHLTVQTDAAINPGNSGGPVVQDGKVVGVAFQGTSQLENTGYFIPTEVVRHFLEDAADGRYDGYPELGVMTSNMENPAARRRAGMRDDQSGVRIDAVFPGGSADGHLQAGDVLLAVDGHVVANDGSTLIDDFRGRFGVVVDRHQIGEKLQVRLLRQGRVIETAVTMRSLPRLRLLANSYDRRPRYFVYGGLVFMPLDRELLTTYGQDLPLKTDLLYELYQRPLMEPQLKKREPVVLLRRLNHAVNANMAWHRDQVVQKVNGREIRDLEDLIDAVESNRGRFHVFEFTYHHRFGVLDRRQADAANEEILRLYGIPEDRHL
ncbi:MAG: trypsin-like peptidase domain-containing protein [Acidobacteriota bacterium]|nr:trypsin-like peptidase domain-containing protein [Acidobacteriota bacterium]